MGSSFLSRTFLLQPGWAGLFLPSHPSRLLGSPLGTMVEAGEGLSFTLGLAQQVLPTPSDYPGGRY